MRELRLVAVSDDGSHLVVRSNEPDGEQFRLPLDERLRAAVRRDVPRVSQLEIRRESSLTPREIQARLRAGESPEDVAHAAGVSVERVTRFEGPVLAERQRRVEEARAATPHRPGGSPHEPLGDLAEAFLARERVDPESVAWDACLGEDGTWLVLLSYRVGDRTRSARWSWDVGRHHLAPLDKGAEIIAQPPPDPSPLPRLAPVVTAAPAVHDPWAPEGTSEPTPTLLVEDELSELGRRAAAPEAVRLPPTAAAADPPAAAVSEQPAAADDVPAVAEVPTVEDELTHDVGTAEPTRAGGPRSARRASVPSWDDILLGTRPQP